MRSRSDLALRKESQYPADQLKLLEIHSPPRAESVDSITLGKSFIDVCKSDDMSIFVDTLNVWHERLPEVGFERAGAKDNVPKHEAISQSESRSWERIQSLIQPSRSAGQIVLLDCAGNNVGLLAPLCTVKRATLRIILPDDIAHFICLSLYTWINESRRRLAASLPEPL